MLTLYYEPDIGANAVLISELAQELAERGMKITVITGFPHYADNTLESDYRGKIFANESRGNIKVVRTYLYTSPNKASFWVRFLNYVSFNVLSTVAGIFSGPQDLILAPSPPLTIGFSAAVIGFLKRIPYIYNVQDINPDVLIKLGILKNRLFIRFSKWLEKFVYRQAEMITVLSEGFRENLRSKSVPDEKLVVIPNFIDPDFVQPLPRNNDFRQKHHLQDKFVVLYAGNLGHSQNLEDLLDCASQLQEDRQLEFVIVGNGSRKPFLEDYARELALNNVIFLPFQPRDDVPQVYAAADLSLVTLKKGIALDSVPSKLYTIMASGRPVLAAVDPGSDAWNLVQEANCGICVPPEDPAALKAAIAELRSQPERIKALAKAGRAYVVKHHTRDIIGDVYQQLFSKIINEKTNESF